VLAIIRAEADIYVINSDAPAASRQLKAISGISVPVLLDPSLAVARQYDFLPKPGQPMAGMTGVAQMGFVIVDRRGTIQVQRADICFGQHAGQIAEILRRLATQGRWNVARWNENRRAGQRVDLAEASRA
jgi:peroxiredoxin